MFRAKKGAGKGPAKPAEEYPDLINIFKDRSDPVMN